MSNLKSWGNTVTWGGHFGHVLWGKEAYTDRQRNKNKERYEHQTARPTLCILQFLAKVLKVIARATLCLKKRHPLYIGDNLVKCHPILPILAETFKMNTSFSVRGFMFILCTVKTDNNFYRMQYSIKLKISHKTSIVTSNKCQVMLTATCTRNIIRL